MKSPALGALLMALACSGNVVAVRVDAPAPNPDSVRRASPATTTQADDRNALRTGTITAVSDKRDQVEINGSWLKLTDGQTQVFRRGRLVKGADELAKGQTVRFTLAPSATDVTTLGVVYVP